MEKMHSHCSIEPDQIISWQVELKWFNGEIAKISRIPTRNRLLTDGNDSEANQDLHVDIIGFLERMAGFWIAFQTKSLIGFSEYYNNHWKNL